MSCSQSDRLRWIAEYLELAGKLFHWSPASRVLIARRISAVMLRRISWFWPINLKHKQMDTLILQWSGATSVLCSTLDQH